jgi:hypothetical protein
LKPLISQLRKLDGLLERRSGLFFDTDTATDSFELSFAGAYLKLLLEARLFTWAAKSRFMRKLDSDTQATLDGNKSNLVLYACLGGLVVLPAAAPGTWRRIGVWWIQMEYEHEFPQYIDHTSVFQRVKGVTTQDVTLF